VPTVERVSHERAGFRLLEVTACEDLTPHLRRITLAGEELESFRSAAPDDHVKLFFPAEPDGEVVVPIMGEHGVEYPEDKPRPAARDFTPRRFDNQAGELVVEFVLHGHGPAGRWAAAAAPGTRIVQAGPRGSRVASEDFDWYLLVSDEAGLPAVGRRLEELPQAARAIVIAEVADAGEELEFVSSAEVEITWLHRGDAEPGTTSLLIDAVRALELPAGDGFAWAGAEAETARTLRHHLREERGLPKEWTRVTGYWRRGVADHHDPPDAN
jgi:NADPH-dependent ferric siderophore reductase